MAIKLNPYDLEAYNNKGYKYDPIGVSLANLYRYEEAIQ